MFKAPANMLRRGPKFGFGTSIIAGEMTGRCVHALELNPAYDVAVIRWQSFKGKTAMLKTTGESFEATMAGARSAGSASSGEDRAAFEAQGWVFAADLGPVHGCFTVLMRSTTALDDPPQSQVPEGRRTHALDRARRQAAGGEELHGGNDYSR